ncbi:hypothetical protein RB653_008580 [Dictyostelium firmibasis]|uniref:Uncharacterized protein n=1 Tax=Dictyostelium firmibasis TaxID=79012 RepID=A0AAN7U0J8_9MYCE
MIDKSNNYNNINNDNINNNNNNNNNIPNRPNLIFPKEKDIQTDRDENNTYSNDGNNNNNNNINGNNNNNNNNNINNNNNNINNNNNDSENDSNDDNDNEEGENSESKNQQIDRSDMDEQNQYQRQNNEDIYSETPESMIYLQEQGQEQDNDSIQQQIKKQKQKQKLKKLENKNIQQQDQGQLKHHHQQQQQQQHQQLLLLQQQQQQQHQGYQMNNQQNKQYGLIPSLPTPESKVVPQTFSCWVHCGFTEIKEEIRFEHVWRYNHLRPYIKIAFGIEQLSPYIQMYNDSSLNSNSIIDPEDLFSNYKNKLPTHIFIKVLSQQQINSALFLGISNYSVSSNFNHPMKNNNNNHNEKLKTKVRIFSNDIDKEPVLEFENGIDMNTIEKNFNIVGGWLKKKGDLNSRRVKSPFNSGDYVLVGSIPIYKTITIIYHGFFSFFDKTQNVRIKYSDNHIEISEKILNSFVFNNKTKFQLFDICGGFFIDDLNFSDLSDDKTYELKINSFWSRKN